MGSHPGSYPGSHTVVMAMTEADKGLMSGANSQPEKCTDKYMVDQL